MNKVQKYFKAKALNSSKLKVAHNPKLLNMIEMGLLDDQDSAALRIGSAVDCLLTDPDRWDEEFIILDVDKPYGLMGNFIDALPKGITISSPQKDYDLAYELSGYKIGIERVIDKFWSNKNYVTYYKAKTNTDKIVLSASEYDAVQEAVKVLMQNPFALKYYSPVNTMFQVPIYFEHNHVKCKALVDGIYIDDENKRICPFDLKTTSKDILKFKDIFYSYGYNIQAGLYYMAIEYWKIQNKQFADYETDNFRFIVTPSKVNSVYPAMIFKLKEETLRECVEEVENKIELYKWYLDNNRPILPREVLENEGELLI